MGCSDIMLKHAQAPNQWQKCTYDCFTDVGLSIKIIKYNENIEEINFLTPLLSEYLWIPHSLSSFLENILQETFYNKF